MANTQTSVPAFTAGQVLTAAQMTEINTGIPVFADTTARDAAFGGTGEKTLAEGQFAYIESSNVTQFYDGTSWQLLGGVVQVKSAFKDDTFTMASATFTDITGLTVSITPTSSSNKVLCIATSTMCQSVGTNNGFVRLARGGTGIGVGAAAGSRIPSAGDVIATNALFGYPVSVSFLDSPATTSATTYSLQVANNGSATIYVNRSQTDTNSSSFSRYSSTITVLEVTP